MRPGRAGSGIKKGGFSFFTRNIFRCEPGKGGGDCKIEYFLSDESKLSIYMELCVIVVLTSQSIQK